MTGGASPVAASSANGKGAICRLEYPVSESSRAYCTPGHGTCRQAFVFSTSQHHISMAIHTLPAGWSLLATRPRDELHQALLTSTYERSFEDVPVDWWDRSADVWRPTSIVRLLGGVWDVGRDVEVLVPDTGGPSAARISIAQVRLSRLLTAGVSRYWVARYQKLLVLRSSSRRRCSAATLIRCDGSRPGCVTRSRSDMTSGRRRIHRRS